MAILVNDKKKKILIICLTFLPNAHTVYKYTYFSLLNGILCPACSVPGATASTTSS